MLLVFLFIYLSAGCFQTAISTWTELSPVDIVEGSALENEMILNAVGEPEVVTQVTPPPLTPSLVN